MKLTFDERAGAHAVTGYGDGWVQVGDRRVTAPCVLTPTGLVTDLLPATLEALSERDLVALLALAPDLVLLGTGVRQRFVDAAYARALAARGVGLEVMDTGAACRSYNVLLAEDRAVVAALFMR